MKIEFPSLASFTPQYFEQYLRSPMKHSVVRILDPSKPSYDGVRYLPPPEEGDFFSLIDAATGNYGFFTSHDLDGDVKAVSFETQVKFADTLRKVFSPQFLNSDFHWSLQGQSVEGDFRFESGICLVPSLAKVLRKIKLNAPKKRIAVNLDITKTGTNPDQIRIVVPGSHYMENYSRDEHLTEPPQEAFRAIALKTRGEGKNHSFWQWPSVRHWSEVNPATSALHRGTLWTEGKVCVNTSAWTHPPSDAVVVKPHLDAGTADSKTGHFFLLDASSIGDLKTADLPAIPDIKAFWVPSSTVPPLAEFWEAVDKLYAGRQIRSFRVHSIKDEAISVEVDRNFNSNDWKILVFDRLDSANIWLRG